MAQYGAGEPKDVRACSWSPRDLPPSGGQLLYQAASPDEEALVTAARNFGYVFLSRTQDTITVMELGERRVYRVLAMMDFNSTRKRMSVLVRKPEGTICLYTKGADTVIFERLHRRGATEFATEAALAAFAQETLRTLCLAYREVAEDIYEEWQPRHQEASLLLQNRAQALQQVYSEMEQNLKVGGCVAGAPKGALGLSCPCQKAGRLLSAFPVLPAPDQLLGATAIEDRLQDGVRDTIKCLKKSNIKIWVLTGDKQGESWWLSVAEPHSTCGAGLVSETAVNVGFACELLSENMVILEEKEITRILESYWDSSNNFLTKKSLSRVNLALVINGDFLVSVTRGGAWRSCMLRVGTAGKARRGRTGLEAMAPGIAPSPLAGQDKLLVSLRKEPRALVQNVNVDKEWQEPAQSRRDFLHARRLSLMFRSFGIPLAPPPSPDSGVRCSSEALQEHTFVDLASHCQAVICCRVTPKQKALIVALVKKYHQVVTLAIGDGANDVNMIKTADVGVGLAGQEGMQAVQNSDFVLGQFCFLQRLLLVHGRWSYMRISKFLRYFFYKTVASMMVQVWFAFYNGFTAQPLYEGWFLALYNLLYSTLPVLYIGLFEQCSEGPVQHLSLPTATELLPVELTLIVGYPAPPITRTATVSARLRMQLRTASAFDVSAEQSLGKPELYMVGQKDELFNYWVFFQAVAHGMAASVVNFFMTLWISWDTAGPASFSDHQSFAVVVALSCLLSVTMEVILIIKYWSALCVVSILLSLGFYAVMTSATQCLWLFRMSPKTFPFLCEPPWGRLGTKVQRRSMAWGVLRAGGSTGGTGPIPRQVPSKFPCGPALSADVDLSVLSSPTALLLVLLNVSSNTLPVLGLRVIFRALKKARAKPRRAGAGAPRHGLGKRRSSDRWKEPGSGPGHSVDAP
ncbi:Phospholipid-transporting ATPase IK [Saguinus oedipus]|uniref:Phospholipid-transporting ATPase IK n=1 Tax=Saguinus oedipus TaxID=9490 RepID=A0ABQ9TQI5_SAGOE|nr:Phospholipid-transporting ATPase IK [Saguinus oedipus]